MIDLEPLTNYRRNPAELQEFWLLCLMAVQTLSFGDCHRRRLQQFFTSLPIGDTPFHKLILARIAGHDLKACLHTARLDKLSWHTRPKLLPGFIDSALRLNDLSQASLAMLESIEGSSPKIARLFLLHTRPEQRLVILGKHTLRWLRQQHAGLAPLKVPESPALYAELEQHFLNLVELTGQTVAAFDAALWVRYHQRGRHLTPDMVATQAWLTPHLLVSPGRQRKHR